MHLARPIPGCCRASPANLEEEDGHRRRACISALPAYRQITFEHHGFRLFNRGVSSGLLSVRRVPKTNYEPMTKGAAIGRKSHGAGLGSKALLSLPGHPPLLLLTFRQLKQQGACVLTAAPGYSCHWARVRVPDKFADGKPFAVWLGSRCIYAVAAFQEEPNMDHSTPLMPSSLKISGVHHNNGSCCWKCTKWAIARFSGMLHPAISCGNAAVSLHQVRRDRTFYSSRGWGGYCDPRHSAWSAAELIAFAQLR